MALVHVIELLYLCDEYFRNRVDQIRDLYGFKNQDVNNNFNEEIFLKFEKKLLTNDGLRSRYRYAYKDLIYRYQLRGLEEYLQIFIESKFILSHIKAFRSRHTFGFIPYYRKYMGGTTNMEALKGIFPWFTLVIKRKIAGKDLDKWYKKVKPEIIADTNSFYGTNRESYINVPTYSRVKKIFELRNYKKMPFSKIAKTICDNHPKARDVLRGLVNEQSVKNKYAYWSKYFKK